MKISIEKELIKQTQKINITLRQALFCTTNKLDDIRRIPFHGKMVDGMPTDSLGPFPEFILPTNICNRTLQGFCSPCFFSKVPLSSRPQNEIYDSLLVQTKYIIDNFDELVLNFQARQDEMKNYWDITFCYACNGSIFSNAETTKHTRYEAFKMLSDMAKEKKLRTLVYIETCVGDYINFLNSDEFNSIYPMLKVLNAVILFGFESINDLTRNYIYLKNLELSDFEYAVQRNNELGLATGAFLYTGHHSLSQSEIIEDAKESVKYLISKNVMPVVMFPNIHEYTLTHLLYKYGKYNLIDPQTALEIFMYVDLEARKNENYQNHKCDAWLMGDLFGGPPTPPNNFFNNKNKISCDKCSELIRSTLQKARQNHKPIAYEDIINKLEKCENHCRQHYNEFIVSEKDMISKYSILERVRETINFAELNCEKYLNEMGEKNV